MNDAWGSSATSRRALLTLGVSSLLAWPLAACDDSATPGARPSRTRMTYDPQRALASNATNLVFGLGRDVQKVLAAHPALARTTLAGFARLHRRQVARLGIEPGDVRSLPFPKVWMRDPTKAADAIRLREESGAGELASWTLKAESGALAGLIAQLAAGIDVRLAATAAAPGSLDVEPEIPNASPTIQVDAMQKTLADEHAALYLYGVLGAHTSASRSPALYTAVDAAYVAHRARRDRLTALLEDAGKEPVASEPGYRLPAPVRTDRQIADEGLRLERGAAARYLWLVENSTDDVRAFAVAALRNTAVRELSFRGSPEIFPGAI